MKDIERMVISAYSDGEVEAPWKDQVGRKIADDPSWAAEAELQGRIKAALAAAPEPDFSAAAERVKARVVGGAAATNRRTLPVAWFSVAAAALLVVAAGAGYWWGRQSVPSGPADVAELKVQVPRQLELKLSGEGQLLMASTLEAGR